MISIKLSRLINNKNVARQCRLPKLLLNGTTSVDSIFECPNSWPGTIMKWIRLAILVRN